MEKSYILKFNETKGDYVIVENKSQTASKPKKSLFEMLSGGFFRKRDENQLKYGLNKLDNSVPNTNNANNPNNLQNNQNLPQNGINLPQNNQNLQENNENLQNNQNNLTQPNNPNNSNVLPNNNSGNLPNDNQTNNNLQNPNNNLPNSNTPQVFPNTPTFITPTPDNALSVADSLPLISSLYSKFRVLNMIYQNLRSINSNFAQIFNDYIAINTALQGGLLNIFNSLSPNRSIQNNESVPALPARAQDIFKIVADQIQDMREINFQLLNLFEVEEIDRQLNLIETALSIQASQVTNLRLDSQN